MPKRILLLVALAFAIVTPVLAQESPPADATDPVVTSLNKQKARAEAQKALYEAQKAAAEARFAPLSRFAGDGSSSLSGEHAGGMETAYLAAATMRGAATTLNREVGSYLSSAHADGPRERAVLITTKNDSIGFQHVTAFEAESARFVADFDLALNLPAGNSCMPPPQEQSDPGQVQTFGADPISVAGAIIGLFASETTVQGMTGLGDEGLLINSLARAAPARYVLQGAILTPELPVTHPIVQRIAGLDGCAFRARQAKANPSNDAQKATLDAVLERWQIFRGGLFSAGEGGDVPIVSIYREALLRDAASRFILHLQVERSGGTLLTSKNLWTALGAPAITLSGGTIVSYRLFERRTGRLATGGTIICRTPTIGLRAAMVLQRVSIDCQDSDGNMTRIAG